MVKRSDAKAAPAVRFRATLHRPGGSDKGASWNFLRLPESASRALPSRGIVSVTGTLHGCPFQAALQPDGRGGHWLKLDQKECAAAGVEVGDTIALDLTAATTEPEPKVPPDLRKALAAASSKAREAWVDITPAARRDFIHWIVSPKRPETRAKRIEATCDMLAKGKRRPCCFDRSGMFDKSLSCPVADDEE